MFYKRNSEIFVRSKMSDGTDNADLRTGEICRLIDLFNIYPSMKGNKYLFKRKFPVIGGIKIWIIICK